MRGVVLAWWLTAGSTSTVFANICSPTHTCDDPSKPICCQMREDIYTCINSTQTCCPQSFSHGYGAVCSGSQQCCWGYSILTCYDNSTEICCSGNYAAACPNTDKCGGSTMDPKCEKKPTVPDETSEPDGENSAAFMAEYYRRRGEITWVDDIPVAERTGGAGAIDWVEKGAVTPATSQGRCATCQDFSAIADVEGAWFRSGLPLIKLSEQELIDCVSDNDFSVL